MSLADLDERPVVVVIAGPNGAGKTTVYHAHLENAGLLHVNADDLAHELDLDPYAAARVAGAVRRELIRMRESFVFETVFSDPVGDKLDFLSRAASVGYTVLLCFVGIPGPDVSSERVSMRVSQGGHDVPEEKLISRFPRILANLGKAIRRLPRVIVYDNGNLSRPFRCAAVFEAGRLVSADEPMPEWLRGVLP